MCMSNVLVTKRDEKGNVSPKNGVFFGYKAFMNKSRLNDELGLFDFNYGKTKQQVGKWVQANNDVLESSSRAYTSGFHIFTSFNDVLNYLDKLGYGLSNPNSNMVVHRVQFRDIVAIGKEQGSICIIAKKLKILEEVKS